MRVDDASSVQQRTDDLPFTCFNLLLELFFVCCKSNKCAVRTLYVTDDIPRGEKIHCKICWWMRLNKVTQSWVLTEQIVARARLEARRQPYKKIFLGLSREFLVSSGPLVLCTYQYRHPKIPLQELQAAGVHEDSAENRGINYCF